MTPKRAGAADFLREIAPSYPKAKAHLEAAAGNFAAESAALACCQKLLGDREKGITDEQCVGAAAYLSEARAMYQLGIEEIERSLRDLPG